MRAWAIDRLVEQFLAGDAKSRKQILSLGAGTDTRFFRLISKGASPSLIYHEFDFAEVTSEKIRHIRDSPSLFSMLQSSAAAKDGVQVSTNGNSLTSKSYNIHPLDLRNLSSPDSLSNTERSVIPNLIPDVPTLILSECCLCYLPSEDADKALQYVISSLVPSPAPVAVVLYEPIRPDDSFGRVMVSNFAARGIVMPTLERYPSLEMQRERLRNVGFATAQRSADIDHIWEVWLNNEDRERIQRLEFLDELEEWRLLAQHYCIAWAWRENTSGQMSQENASVFTSAWDSISSQ